MNTPDTVPSQHIHSESCGCGHGAHHHPAVDFKVDGEKLLVHASYLSVREILDLVSENPAKHYLVKLSSPENITYRNPDDIVPLATCDEFFSVYTGETPLS